MSEPSIYAKAIDVIRERGWTQATGQGVCLVQAVCPTYSPDEIDAYTALREAAGVPALWHWNDAPERTVEDVYVLLKYADAGELDTWKTIYGPGSEAS